MRRPLWNKGLRSEVLCLEGGGAGDQRVHSIERVVRCWGQVQSLHDGGGDIQPFGAAGLPPVGACDRRVDR